MKKKTQSKNQMILALIVLVSIVIIAIVGLNTIRKNKGSQKAMEATDDTLQLSDDSDSIVNRVIQLPEVQEFKQAVEENGRSTFYAEVEDFASSDPNSTVIRVFEVFPDHQTTFNRYSINTQGTISRYDGVNDRWEVIK
ncbi:MAG: hypothetical protein NUV98_00340 [Candidatus Roizmanbacteria bacterium]|nr:hypothetical protein [Candidatus Roizmanbacteria bacterium]